MAPAVAGRSIGSSPCPGPAGCDRIGRRFEVSLQTQARSGLPSRPEAGAMSRLQARWSPSRGRVTCDSPVLLPGKLGQFQRRHYWLAPRSDDAAARSRNRSMGCRWGSVLGSPTCRRACFFRPCTQISTPCGRRVPGDQTGQCALTMDRREQGDAVSGINRAASAIGSAEDAAARVSTTQLQCGAWLARDVR